MRKDDITFILTDQQISKWLYIFHFDYLKLFNTIICCLGISWKDKFCCNELLKLQNVCEFNINLWVWHVVMIKIFQINKIGMKTYFNVVSKGLSKNKMTYMMVIQRCQNVPKIFVSGFMSNFNRQYFGMVGLFFLSKY